MNWASVDAALLAHARKLGQFRAAHVALARGRHVRLAQQPYVFARIDELRQDRVLVAPEVHGNVSVPVAGVFADGQRLRDAYTGNTAVVRQGRVSLQAAGMLLLEATPDSRPPE